ncbi:MAG: AMP-binding protein, partial [Ktedonobacteraceae bacterium]|nr:AMP-binding protein [Ktedonobacteraceae bacterium]
LVATEGQELIAADLRAFLATLLPEYMLPTLFVPLEELPVTPNGKVDRDALPEPVFSEQENRADYVAPRTETERILVNLCQEVLSIEQISVHDNIFMLGAYSLLATLIMSRVRAAFQVVLPLVTIFQAPTMAQLAELIEQARPNTPLETPPMITTVERDKPIPLSFSQERVWFMHYLDPSNTSYHFQATLRFKGHLHVEAVERALNEIVRRHEIFRTSVQEIDGQPMQNIHAFTPFTLPIIDIRDLPPELREARFSSLVQQESRRLFDLSCLPLVRWTLVQLDDQHYGLIHVEHHLVHDGWSLNVFLREFMALYQAFVSTDVSPLPEPAIQFADFVAWHRQWMQSGVQEQQLHYWKQKLQGAPTLLKLPTDYPRPATQRFKGAAARVEMPKQLYLDLREVGNREGVTLYTVMLAAFCILMACYANQDDFCIGSAIANRRWKETEELLGMLVNNIILRIQLDNTLTLSDLLHQLHALTMEAYENQDVPFDKLVEAVHVERDLSHNPLFQVMFSFHDSAAPALELPELELELLDGINNGSAKFDMNVTAAPRFSQKNGHRDPIGITLVWEYNTDLFTSETIERMLNHLQNILQKLITNPELRLDQLSLLTGAEHQQIVETWNSTATAYPVHCIHELFQEQAARNPTGTALVFEGRSLTYSELDLRSNQLARHLQQCGVGPDVLVGVCMERSFELVIALMGILKAGGGYVPLDPGYPKDRLAYMLEDSGTGVLLTQSHLRVVLPEHTAHTICLDQDWSVLANISAEAVTSGVLPANLAYMIYTSGSTGRPKGAMNTHEALCNRLL